MVVVDATGIRAREWGGPAQRGGYARAVTEVVRCHSALGLRSGVRAVAECARTAGHVVHPRDADDGRTFDDLDAGLERLTALGVDEAEPAGAAVGPFTCTGLA